MLWLDRSGVGAAGLGVLFYFSGNGVDDKNGAGDCETGYWRKTYVIVQRGSIIHACVEGYMYKWRFVSGLDGEKK